MPSPSENPPRLVIIEGKDKGKVIPLKDGVQVIGRSKGDVIIQDPRVSRSHVSLQFDQKTGKLSFTDLKSLNGTTVNGQPQDSGALKDGDKLQLGNTVFDCQLSAQAATDPQPSEEKEVTAEHRVEKRADRAHTKRAVPSDPEPPGRQEPGLRKLSDESSELPLEALAEEPLEPGEAEAQEPARQSLIQSLFHFPKRVALPRVSVSRKTRNLAAAGLLAVLAVYYFGGGSGTKADLEQEVAKLRQLETEGRIEEALGQANALKEKFPNRSEPHFWLGSLYAVQRKNELAIASYRKAKALEPPIPTLPIRLIQVYLRSGLTKEAEEELRNVDALIKSGVHTKELFVEAATLFLEFKELKQPPEKTLILAKALQTELAPGNTIGYKLEAQVLFQQNRTDEAIATLEKALGIDPQDEWLLENLAFARLSNKDIPGAARTVEAWIQVKPTATKALLVMAYLKFNEKNYLGAMPYIQKILQVAANNTNDPHYPEALDLMGQVYATQGQNEEATKFFKQACEAGFSQSCERATAASSPPSATTEGSASGENKEPPVENKAPETEPPAQAAPPADSAEGE